MFDQLRFSYRIWRIRRSDRAWARQNQAKIANARKSNASQEVLDDLEQDYRTNYELTYDQVSKLQTRHLLSQLDKLSIPRPPYILDHDSVETSTWMESRVSGLHMTPQTMVQVREQIRKERKEKSEVFRLWLGEI